MGCVDGLRCYVASFQDDFDDVNKPSSHSGSGGRKMRITQGARSMTTYRGRKCSVMQNAWNADADINLVPRLLSFECS